MGVLVTDENRKKTDREVFAERFKPETTDFVAAALWLIATLFILIILQIVAM